MASPLDAWNKRNAERQPRLTAIDQRIKLKLTAFRHERYNASNKGCDYWSNPQHIPAAIKELDKIKVLLEEALTLHDPEEVALTGYVGHLSKLESAA